MTYKLNHGKTINIILYKYPEQIFSSAQQKQTVTIKKQQQQPHQPQKQAPKIRKLSAIDLKTNPKIITAYSLNVDDFCKIASVNSSMMSFLKNHTWLELFGETDVQTEITKISGSLSKELDIVFPPKELIFHAFNLCDYDQLKVVILGQDPYHRRGEAHGLSFSVPVGITVPPSLKNVYAALENDTNIEPRFKRPNHGNLEHWARQGVLLLNSSLTVLEGQPNVHKSVWAQLTNLLINKIANKKNGVVFMLWGNDAKNKRTFINPKRHLILEYHHPSPMVMPNTFHKCTHFSEANKYLISNGKIPINW